MFLSLIIWFYFSELNVQLFLRRGPHEKGRKRLEF